jgi:hypothetical protein
LIHHIKNSYAKDGVCPETTVDFYKVGKILGKGAFGKVNLSLTKARGAYKKGTQTFQLDVPKGRYDREFIDLAKIVRGEKKLAWDAAHDLAEPETLLRASGIWS